ncbi:MAG: KpsF/GutQ family sugar-phosphate isomerase [Planctomycetota bacterium]|nr:KpsF/GutQ family sugar-phosphate isomerase [Planctomycetota bacterium]MDA1164651.1 KpsF/GutQ family sugar-phosphate isomerase [Planctomycetota bacterium]
MSSVALQHSIPFDQFEQLRAAREIIRDEATALTAMSSRLDTRFCEAVELLRECNGRVIVTGVGKAGLIGQKMTATLSSTGTRAQFLHPTEGVHGDLGCVSADDVVIVFSNSGETEEVCRMLPIIRQLGVRTIAITASSENTLARGADIVLEIGRLREAGELSLAPSTTTTAMLAMSDALALVVSQAKGFTATDFATFHPAGGLGRQLTPIREVMRHGDELRIATRNETVRGTLQRLRSSGRRTGAILVTQDDGTLCGVFTDSDLARLLEQHRDDQLDGPVSEVMTSNPTTLTDDTCLGDAVTVLTERKISELPIVDGSGRPVGLIDITDVIGMAPK